MGSLAHSDDLRKKLPDGVRGNSAGSALTLMGISFKAGSIKLMGFDIGPIDERRRQSPRDIRFI
jgi:hypothetical protein